MSNTKRDFLGVSEAAKESGYTVHGIRKAIRSGWLKATNLNAGYVIRREDFEQWMSNEIAHKPGRK